MTDQEALTDAPRADLWEHPGQGTTVVVHKYDRQASRLSVRLEKNSRGFTWEVAYSGEDLDDVLDRIAEANQRLQDDYGNHDAPVRRTYRR
jgi:hypothetical protein